MATVIEPEKLDQWIGKEVTPSNWFEVDQERINLFADATLDHQFIHVDPDRAAATPFGGTIAHGFLSLSLLPYLLEQAGVMPERVQMAVNYGLNKVRFLNPVRAGSRVRAHVILRDVTEKKPGQLLMTNEVTVEIEGAPKPALIAEALMLYAVDPA
ncbi:dehydratase [Rhodothalassium salexigens]|uniref:MaoC family dehydratase n=1 Tax=Rhodothalassium salexigens TaxID=1086 RepID=UPI001912DC04|nr:MaoC family dehydratase [Rhodothalassium salexigens]MBK5912228.1 dehydratase [Rhodothalassium salexigens]